MKVKRDPVHGLGPLRRAGGIVLLVAAVLGGCATEDGLTEAERAHQSAVDRVVAGMLFDRSLDERASYILRGDGHVHIKFGRDVLMAEYTPFVEGLRSRLGIMKVTAEQAGTAVCQPPR